MWTIIFEISSVLKCAIPVWLSGPMLQLIIGHKGRSTVYHNTATNCAYPMKPKFFAGWLKPFPFSLTR